MSNTSHWASDQSKWHPATLDIEVTSRCNQQCRYCYLGGSGGDDMSASVADDVIRYAERLVEHLPPRRSLTINFFGGEPFMAFDVMQYIVRGCNSTSMPVRFEVFTNGATARPHEVRWCRTHNVYPNRSAGGCPAACNRTRPGTYLAQYEEESRRWGDYGAVRRVTVIPETAVFLMETVRYLHAKGYYGPIDFATDNYATWSPSNVLVYCNEFTKLAAEFVRQFQMGRVLGVTQFLDIGKRMFHESGIMSMGCGAGWGLQAVTHDGWIVPCHRFLREPHNSPMCGGSLRDRVDGKATTFGECMTQRVLDCADCRESDRCVACEARQHCNHGCLHVSWKSEGSPSEVPVVHCLFARHYGSLVRWINDQLEPVDYQWFLRPPTPCVLPEAD